MDKLLNKLEPYWASILDRPDDLIAQEIFKFYRHVRENGLYDLVTTENFKVGYTFDPEGNELDYDYIYDILLYPKPNIFRTIIGVKISRARKSISSYDSDNDIEIERGTRINMLYILFDQEYVFEIFDQCNTPKAVEV